MLPGLTDGTGATDGTARPVTADPSDGAAEPFTADSTGGTLTGPTHGAAEPFSADSSAETDGAAEPFTAVIRARFVGLSASAATCIIQFVFVILDTNGDPLERKCLLAYLIYAKASSDDGSDNDAASQDATQFYSVYCALA